MTLALNKQKLDNLADEIWKSAQSLRGKFKAYEYQNVILPIIVICWQDSPQLGYEILPNKYFHRYEPPTPARELLEKFWKLEKEAEKLLEGLAR